MRIAVISDTHDQMPAGLPERLAEADEIWHLGDVCDPTTLIELEMLGRPLFVVRGNCDPRRWPLERRLERDGLTYGLIHIPPDTVPEGVDVVLHGHTHVPRDVTDAAGVRWINPGCVSNPRGHGCSFAWLETQPGGLTSWRWERI